ncbi:unnamed protein product [Arabidopsis halleri]
MGKLQHGSHECELTSPEIVANGICNICFKDEPVEFACDPCNFDLCKPCSDLPQQMSHHLHPEHPLEFRIGEDDRKTKYMVCVGCGNMSSGTYYYECNKCEIYLDLGCALQKSITTGWEAKEMLHYSHEHQLKRCRPGPDSKGSCLLCEQPLSFTATCYGCIHCYLFFHERCLDLPTEIQHPVHPMHPLKRLDYIQTFDGRKSCSACTGSFVGVPFGCLECGFYLHLRCADALLRGLLYKSHEHRLFYVEDTFNHIHVMRLVHMSELEEEGKCNMCDTKIHGNPCKCETCSFQSHDFCAGLGGPSRHQFHLNHPLTLLPNSPRWMKRTCKSCKVDIKGFNLFCRICNFIIDINCALKDKKMHGALHMGQIGLCIQDKHSLFQVIVSRSYPIACSICEEKLCGKAFSCVMCEDIYHPLCIQVGRRVLVGHPLHSDHMIAISLLESGSKGPAMPSQKREKPQCTACQLNITTKYSYHCTICKINFHIDCIKAVIVPSKIKSHSHYLYNFWNNDMRVTRA